MTITYDEGLGKYQLNLNGLTKFLTREQLLDLHDMLVEALEKGE